MSRIKISWILLLITGFYTFIPTWFWGQEYQSPTSQSSYNLPTKIHQLKILRGTFSIFSNPYKYSDYYADQESGFCYCNARYYSPELMRFINRDTYDVSNRYAYCDGNPITNIDPSGHAPDPIIAFLCLSNHVLDLTNLWSWYRYNPRHPIFRTLSNIALVADSASVALNWIGSNYGMPKVLMMASTVGLVATSINIYAPIMERGFLLPPQPPQERSQVTIEKQSKTGSMPSSSSSSGNKRRSRHSKTSEEGCDFCPICHMPFLLGDDVATVHCSDEHSHRFHVEKDGVCIGLSGWCKNGHDSCPMCRKPFDTKPVRDYVQAKHPTKCAIM
jgi:RHS repeat-associated protein